MRNSLGGIAGTNRCTVLIPVHGILQGAVHVTPALCTSVHCRTTGSSPNLKLQRCSASVSDTLKRLSALGEGPLRRKISSRRVGYRMR